VAATIIELDKYCIKFVTANAMLEQSQGVKPFSDPEWKIPG
jgi:hypothetical protein